MPVEIPLEQDEELIFSDSFQADSRSLPFAFAVSDRAVFISKEKHFAKEAWYFERIPINQVKQMFLRRERSLPILIFSGLILIAGLILTFVMMSNALNQAEGTKVSGVPFAMIVAGLIVPFLAKGREILIVESDKGTFKWKPRLVVDKESKNRIKKLQKDILDVSEKVGIKVIKDDKK